MGVLSFCRLALRRGRLSEKPGSKRAGSKNNGNDNKRVDIAGGVDPQAHEARFELGVVHDPADATVDIVAVHGLGVGFESWDSRTEKGETWLTTTLPEDFPTARVITLSQTSETPGIPLRDAINQGASQLLRGLRDLRLNRNEARRPLVFMSHSLGGLLVQRALVTSMESDELTLRDVYVATQGMMYFGVPGLCAGVDRLQGVLADISRIATGSGRKDGGYLDSFRADALALADGMSAFEIVGDRLHSVSACFCETLPTETPSGRFIVDQDCVARAAELITLCRSHADLMRFDGSDDDGYDALKEWIAFVLNPVVPNNDSGPLYLDLEYTLSLAAAHDEVSFLGTDFDVPSLIAPVSPYYIRAHLLDTLHDRFAELLWTGRIPALSLAGPPGVGRTFLARHFSHQTTESGRTVFWLDAASRETLYASYLEVGGLIYEYYWERYSGVLLGLNSNDPDTARGYLASLLGFPDLDGLFDVKEFDQVDQLRVDVLVKGIVSWLLYPENEWLLVLDNVGDGLDLTEFLPLKLDGWILLIPQGSVANLPPGTVTMDIAPWSEDEACELLLEEAGQHAASQENAARDVVHGLECRPSHVAHTALIIRERGVLVNDYLASTSNVDEILSSIDEHPRRDQMTEVLSVVSILSDTPLPLDLLASIENTTGTRLSGDSGCAWWRHSEAEIRRPRLLDSLQGLELLEQVAPTLFRLPAPLRTRLRKDDPRLAWLAASACVTTLQRLKIAPGSLSSTHSAGRRLLPHVLTCHDWLDRLADYEPSKREPKSVDFSVLGELCVTQGFRAQAVGFFEVALRRGERDGESLDAAQGASVMLYLATLLKGKDDSRSDELLGGIQLCDGAMDPGLEFRVRFAQAERLIERGQLDDGLTVLDRLTSTYPENPTGLGSIHVHRSLARVYKKKGFHESSATCHAVITNEYRALFGPCHLATLREEESWALALAETLRVGEAMVSLSCDMTALAAILRIHPSAYEMQFQLALLNDGMLKYEEADELFSGALVGMEGCLGEYHPGYLDAKEALGLCFLGRARRAGRMGEKGVEGEMMGIAGGLFRDVVASRGEVGIEAGRAGKRLAEVEEWGRRDVVRAERGWMAGVEDEKLGSMDGGLVEGMPIASRIAVR